MARVKVNFGDVEEFTAVPEGRYDAVIEKIEYREATQQGKYPYLNVEYTLVGDEETEGRKVWEVLSWSPKALFRMRDFFMAAGFEDEEQDFDVDDESNIVLSPDLNGEAVILTIENEFYNKKEVNRVTSTEFVTPPGESAIVASDDEDEEEEGEEEEEEGEEEEVEEEDEDEEEVEEEEEEEEVEEEAPKKRTFRPTTTGAKKTTSAPAKAAPKAVAKVAPKATPKAPVKAVAKTAPAKVAQKKAAAPAKRTFR